LASRGKRSVNVQKRAVFEITYFGWKKVLEFLEEFTEKTKYNVSGNIFFLSFYGIFQNGFKMITFNICLFLQNPKIT